MAKMFRMDVREPACKLHHLNLEYRPTTRSTVLGTRLVGNLEGMVWLKMTPPSHTSMSTLLQHHYYGFRLNSLPTQTLLEHSAVLPRRTWRTQPSRRYIHGCKRIPPKPHRAPRSKATRTTMAPIRSSASFTAIRNPAISVYFHFHLPVHQTYTDMIINSGGVM